MGREIRRVPATWEHPKNATGNYIALHDGFAKRLLDWATGNARWREGLRESWRLNAPAAWIPIEDEHRELTFVEWDGECPKAADYMPDWPDAERTHFQMYETTSEGTPISPVMDSPEALARWLADTGASAFGSETATYEQWLRVCRGGYAPSAVATGGVLTSGVAGFAQEGEDS